MTKKFQFKRAERLVSVCLDGSLSAAWEANSRDLASALTEFHTLSRVESAKPKDSRMNSAPSPAQARLVELTERTEELTRRASELSAAYQRETVSVRLRALPRRVWEELADQHPAPEDADHGLPFDPDGIAAAALATEGTIVDITYGDGTVEELGQEDWAVFADELSEGQFSDFRSAVVQLNAGSNDVPFLPASVGTDDSAKS